MLTIGDVLLQAESRLQRPRLLGRSDSRLVRRFMCIMDTAHDAICTCKDVDDRHYPDCAWVTFLRTRVSDIPLFNGGCGGESMRSMVTRIYIERQHGH